MTMGKLEKILEKLDPSLFKTVSNKCPCPFLEKVMILINAWVFIRICVVYASLDNQCDTSVISPKHAFGYMHFILLLLMNILDCTA